MNVTTLQHVNSKRPKLRKRHGLETSFSGKQIQGFFPKMEGYLRKKVSMYSKQIIHLS